jgi:excisionase family DNA binding protein
METRLISIEQAAEQLGLKVPTLRLWAARRKISSVKLGRRRLLKMDEIEKLIERNLIPALPHDKR